MLNFKFAYATNANILDTFPINKTPFLHTGIILAAIFCIILYYNLPTEQDRHFADNLFSGGVLHPRPPPPHLATTLIVNSHKETSI